MLLSVVRVAWLAAKGTTERKGYQLHVRGGYHGKRWPFCFQIRGHRCGLRPQEPQCGAGKREARQEKAVAVDYCSLPHVIYFSYRFLASCNGWGATNAVTLCRWLVDSCSAVLLTSLCSLSHKYAQLSVHRHIFLSRCQLTKSGASVGVMRCTDVTWTLLCSCTPAPHSVASALSTPLGNGVSPGRRVIT